MKYRLSRIFLNRADVQRFLLLLLQNGCAGRQTPNRHKDCDKHVPIHLILSEAAMLPQNRLSDLTTVDRSHPTPNRARSGPDSPPYRSRIETPAPPPDL
jgi:hypothetical protein